MKQFLDRIWPSTHSEPTFAHVGWEAVRQSPHIDKLLQQLAMEEKLAVGVVPGDGPVWANMALPLVVIATERRAYLFGLDLIAKEPSFRELMEEGSLKIIFDALDLSLALGAYGLKPSPIFCIHTADRLLRNGLDMGRDLDELAKEVLGFPLSAAREEGTLKAHIQALSDETAGLLAIETHLQPQLQEASLSSVMALEMGVLPAVTSLLATGVPFDKVRWQEQMATQEREIAALEESRPSTFEGVPMLSHQRVNGLIEEHKIDLNADEYESVWIRLMRRAEQRRASYGANFIRHVDLQSGRLYPTWEPLGTVTGRITAEKPALLSIPRDAVYRRCIRASEGHSMLIGDFSQIELRVAAELSGDTELLKAFQENKDIHRLTAAYVNGISPDDVSYEQRQGAKALNFGMLFGMREKALMEYAWDNYGVVLSKGEAKAHREAFFAAYPTLAQWHQQLLKEAQRDLASYTSLGRRQLYHPDEERLQTKPLNFPVQGTAADGMKKALHYLHSSLRKYGDNVRIVMVIYDEIVLEVKHGLVGKVQQILERSMLRGMGEIVSNVPIKVQFAVGEDWAAK